MTLLVGKYIGPLLLISALLLILGEVESMGMTMENTDIIGKKEFLAAIGQAGSGGVPALSLDLGNSGMKQIPEDICKFKGLRYFNASGNKLEWLPNEIGELCELEHLDLMQNLLSRLPEPMEKLEKLENLNLSENCLPKVPPAVWRLDALSILNLAGNNIWQLSVEVERPALRNLDLSRNKIAILRRNSLRAMPNLQFLSLAHNFLKFVPEEIWCLKKLLHLDLSQNRIDVLPNSIRELKDTLEHLNLQSDHPLQKRGEKGKTLGWWELHEIFEDRVKFSEKIEGQLKALQSAPSELGFSD